MSFIISRGYAEVQIFNTSESDLLSFWNILICICPNSEKSKTEKGITHLHMSKKMQTHLEIIFLCVTNVRPLHIFFIIRIFNGCELRIENSVTTVTVQHREACRVMPNSYPE